MKGAALTNDHDEDEEVGESVCYAHLLCLECGRMLDDEGHDATCTITQATSDT